MPAENSASQITPHEALLELLFVATGQRLEESEPEKSDYGLLFAVYLRLFLKLNVLIL